MFPQLSDHKNEDRTQSQRGALSLFNSKGDVGQTVRNCQAGCCFLELFSIWNSIWNSSFKLLRSPVLIDLVL